MEQAQLISAISASWRTIGRDNMKKYIFIASIGIAVLCGPFSAYAAALKLVANGPAVVGQPFRVDVVLDTQGDTLNAVQATIHYPANLVSVENVDDGNSIINFWVTPPAVSSSEEISFAGIVPGGFSGHSGPITSLIFNPLVPGAASISIATATVFRNDGQGTAVPVSLSNLSFGVSLPASGTPPVAPVNSLITPNSFTPEIAKDPNIFDGNYFLVFSTIDKGTGIDHYEVLEVPTGAGTEPAGTWVVAQSPYLLRDQSLSSNIYVRAVDHAGNFIVVEVSARFPHSASPVTLAILGVARAIALVGVLIFLIWFVRRKRRSS
jgi:hypothetical protein